MNHLPFQVVTACRPVVVVDGLVAVDGDEVFAGVTGQLTVEVCGRDHGLLVLGEAACGILHDGKHLGHHVVQGFLINLECLFLELVDLGENIGTLVERGLFDGSLQFLYLGLLLLGRLLYLLADLLCALAQFVVAHLLHCGISLLHLFYERLNELHVARRFVAKQGFQDFVEIHLVYLRIIDYKLRFGLQSY